MAISMIAGLLLGAFAASQGGEIEHRAQIAHPGGPIDAHYRSQVQVTHRQVGSVGAGGRASTLQCVWRAGIAVDRTARQGSGAVATRHMIREKVIEGRRPGWCSEHRGAIDREVALRREELRSHLIDVAREDHAVLNGEIDRIQRGT